MKKVEKPKKGEAAYQKTMNEEQQIEMTMEFKADYRQLSKNITSSDHYSGYSLTVISPKEDAILSSANNKASRASSSLMKYVMHLLLIADIDFSLN